MDINKIYLEEIDSTNLYVKKHIDEIFDRSIVYTYKQTSGRGRLQRSWKFVGEDNIYMTFVLKPSNRLEKCHANLTQYLSVVLANVLEKDYGLSPQIKWPNDVLLNGKKVSGILSESIIRGNELIGIALGIGINLNCKKDVFLDVEKPATSLNLELGKDINKEKFFEKLYSNFFLYYDKFLKDGFPSIREEYLSKASFLNKIIKVSGFDSVEEGLAQDITDEGALVLKTNDNNVITLWIGDIL